MSTKIDCVICLKSKLESEFTKLTTGETPNLPAAQKVQSIALTAENISDGYFAKIEPFFEPVSPKFILMVKVLNEGIISGSSSVADFDEYVALLVSASTAVLAFPRLPIFPRNPATGNGIFGCRDGSVKTAVPPLRDRYRDAQRLERSPFWRDH